MYLHPLLFRTACVFGQELTSTLREGNRTCPEEEIIFTCTIRGSSVLVLDWSSPEYIVQVGSLQLSTANMLGAIRISTGMDGNITATATLTNITIDNGYRVLQSTLRITATVASTVTCSSSGGTGGTGSIEFSISGTYTYTFIIVIIIIIIIIQESNRILSWVGDHYHVMNRACGHANCFFLLSWSC